MNRISWSRPIAHRAEFTVLSPGTRIAPTRSIRTCCQTRLENSGAKGPKTCIIVVGRVRIDPFFWQIAETSIPYFFRSLMTKVELRKVDYALIFDGADSKNQEYV